MTQSFDAAPDVLFRPLALPCGVLLRNRLAKAAMSDSLGDGCGQPTDAQIALYRRWAEGGAGLSIVGEVQGSPHWPEKPGNLVLDACADTARFGALARAGASAGSQMWLQLGHAGALSYAPVATPKGPSALDLPGLRCAAMSLPEVRALPGAFAATARRALDLGFGGVEVHAAHGFVLSQFLSPLFNRRGDAYGGAIQNRMRIVLEVVAAVRDAVGPAFPVGIKINASDQLQGGLEAEDALALVAALQDMSIDLIDISGGTYFPGASASSDRGGSGAYFAQFARAARRHTDRPLMLTGGVKTRAQAVEVISGGDADVIGLARAFALMPELAKNWQGEQGTSPHPDPQFPRFDTPPEGAVTAWYTMRLTAIAEGREDDPQPSLATAMQAYQDRDAARAARWRAHFGAQAAPDVQDTA